MDTRLDRQSESGNAEAEEEFKLSDVGNLFRSRLFWIIALLCVLYYSAIFPFQRFGTNMLQCNLGISDTAAADLLRWFPIGALCLTPPLGFFLDKVGRGASMLILGSVLLICCHLVFALVLPAHPNTALALTTIIVLGVSFSLVPAALWPSVPKVMDARFLGSAYSLIFWVQNIGLFGVPILFGKILDASNPGVTDPTKYDYTNPMLMFALFGVLALTFALWLKVLNTRHHYGLEEPNIKNKAEAEAAEEVPENIPQVAEAEAAGDHDRQDHAHERPIPLPRDDLLKQDAVVELVGQQQPGDAVQQTAEAAEEHGDDHEDAHEGDVPPQFAGDGTAHAGDHAVVGAFHAAFADPAEERGFGVGRGLRGLVWRGRSGGLCVCRTTLPLWLRIVLWIAHGSITAGRQRETPRGTP